MTEISATPTSQKKVIQPTALTTDSPLKSLPENQSESMSLFEHGLLYPCLTANKCCGFVYHNLVSVSWLCCMESKQSQVQFGNVRTKPCLFSVPLAFLKPPLVLLLLLFSSSQSENPFCLWAQFSPSPAFVSNKYFHNVHNKPGTVLISFFNSFNLIPTLRHN